jgi:Tfp pilus assembly protein PilN
LINVNLLPKNLRRVREPGYWRLLAVLVPLLVFGVVFTFQYLAWQTTQNLERDVQAREEQLALLQPFLQEQAELQARQRQLNELIAIAEEVRQNRIVWTGEIAGLLETLPARGDGERPAIDFRTLSMRSVVPPQSNPDRYEGASIVAEMSIGGTVRDLEVLAAFVRNLEDSAGYGVLFQNASRQGGEQEADALYGYSLTVGSLGNGGDE